uniref:Uncharacterized protein n=1 Tax=Megaselia scalaris TaxID=36166 RepID=T1H4D9_MEGSC
MQLLEVEFKIEVASTMSKSIRDDADFHRRLIKISRRRPLLNTISVGKISRRLIVSSLLGERRPEQILKVWLSGVDIVVDFGLKR